MTAQTSFVDEGRSEASARSHNLFEFEHDLDATSSDLGRRTVEKNKEITHATRKNNPRRNTKRLS